MGFGVEGLGGLRLQVFTGACGFGFTVLGFWGFGSRVQGLGVEGLGSWVGFRVLGFWGFGVLGLGFRV